MNTYYHIGSPYQVNIIIEEKNYPPQPELEQVNKVGIKQLKGAELALIRIEWIMFKFNLGKIKDIKINNEPVDKSQVHSKLKEIAKTIFDKYEIKRIGSEKKYSWIYIIFDFLATSFGITTFRQKKIYMEKLYQDIRDSK